MIGLELYGPLLAGGSERMGRGGRGWGRRKGLGLRVF